MVQSAPRRGRAAWWWGLVVLVALVGFVARVWNLDFDQRQHLHPDERHWALTSAALDEAPAPAAHGTIAGPVLDWLDGQRSAANPYRVTDAFPYGPVTLAAARNIAGWLHDGAADGDQPADAVVHALDAVGIPLLDDEGQPRFNDGYEVDLIGRLLGALLDTLTIGVVALVARRLAGPTAGVIAGAVHAGSVLAIQNAHFLGAEPLLGLASALTLLATLRIDRSGDSRRGALTAAVAGLAGGAALAAKLTGGAVALIPLAACAVLVVRHRRRADVARLVAVAIATFVAFRILSPASFEGLGLRPSEAFIDDIRRNRELARADLPPSIQWADRTPVLQPLIWLVRFTIGPGTVLAAAVGAACVLRRRLARWDRAVVLGVVAVPFAVTVTTSVASGRYFTPMLPGVAVLAGVGVAAALRLRPQWRVVGRVAAGSTMALMALWPLAFVAGVYGHEHTRITASRWIDEHVPTGSVLSVEGWDDGLPLRLPGIDGTRFEHQQFDLFGPDDPAKISTLASALARVDYVVESSPRVWNTVVRIPARYPSTIRFFEGLDNGVLGFERVATFTSPPRLGPIVLHDAAAEEAFSVYDHPEVRIWQRVRTVSRHDVIAALDPVAASNALPVGPFAAHANGLLLHADEIAANATGPTYDAAFDTEGSGLKHVVLWFLLLELLGLAAWATLLPLFRSLPDAGLGLSKALALTITSFTIFVAATWLQATIDRGLATTVAVMLVVAGGVSAWRHRAELRALWRTRRTLLLLAEGLSACAFLLVLLLRAANPDLWHPYRGGEKPFELALLTAVLRARTLPVYDPWFSGGSLNYYAGGWFLLSVPARVLRTAPAAVMNLGLATFASCTAGAAFSSVAGASASGRRRLRRRSRSARRASVAGVLGALLVLVAASGSIVPVIWQWLNGTRPETIDWWALSRVVPGTAVTEFPAWSLLFGDLHPHVMDIAVLLLLGGCGLALHRSLTVGSSAAAIGLGTLLGLLVGMVRMTNTWDLPLAIVLAAAPFGSALLARASWRRCLAPAGAGLFVAVIVWAPYARRSEVFDSGFDRATLHTPWPSWLQQFGYFAAVALLAVAVHLRPSFARSPRLWGRIRVADAVGAACALIVVGLALLARDRWVLTTCVVLGVACAWAARCCVRAGRGAPSAVGPALLALGWWILAAVEVYTVRNDAGRTNTVFKFWFQAWIVLAAGAAVVLADQLRAALVWARRDRSRPRWPARTAVALCAFAGVTTAAFWALALPPRLDDRTSAGGWSFDGEAAVRQGIVVDVGTPTEFDTAVDMPLVDWLRANVAGIHVVAEAPGIDYRWTGRISWLTGLPTPIGWAYHETQQRRPYGAAISARVDDMTTLFKTGDPGEMARVLRRYDVEYVVFGTQERLLATAATAHSLRSFRCLDVRFEGTGISSGLWVAAVDRDCVSRWPGSG